jgi:hypothetical protein
MDVSIDKLKEYLKKVHFYKIIIDVTKKNQFMKDQVSSDVLLKTDHDILKEYLESADIEERDEILELFNEVKNE